MPHFIIPNENFQDPRWQQKRLEIMQRDNWSCCAEGKHDGALNVHHRKYTTSEPWNEVNENLITVCNKHHKAEHDSLGAAADDVAMALKNSNWMVKHRQSLQKCIEESTITADEFFQFVAERKKANARKSSARPSSNDAEQPMEVKDRKVLSVPAGKTLHHLTEHNVYSCPDAPTHPEHATNVSLLTPRDSDERMHNVYLIKARIIADPKHLVFPASTTPETIDAIRGYACAVNHIPGILDGGGRYRFYVLGDSKDGSLPIGPTLDRHGAVHCYVSLRELLTDAPIIHVLEECTFPHVP